MSTILERISAALRQHRLRGHEVERIVLSSTDYLHYSDQARLAYLARNQDVPAARYENVLVEEDRHIPSSAVEARDAGGRAQWIKL